MSKSGIGLAVLGSVLLGGGVLASSAVAQSEPSAKQCTVTVDRRPELGGVYDVTRQELANGDCVCYVYTGPQPQSETIESSIAALQQSGDCPDAKPAAYVPDEAAQAGAAGSSDTARAAVLGIATVGGGILAVAAGGDGDNDSAGG